MKLPVGHRKTLRHVVHDCYSGAVVGMRVVLKRARAGDSAKPPDIDREHARGIGRFTVPVVAGPAQRDPSGNEPHAARGGADRAMAWGEEGPLPARAAEQKL